MQDVLEYNILEIKNVGSNFASYFTKQ